MGCDEASHRWFLLSGRWPTEDVAPVTLRSWDLDLLDSDRFTGGGI